MNMKFYDSKTMQQHFDEQRKMTESLPEDIRQFGPYIDRYERSRKKFAIFPEFCMHILERFPGFAYVFIDRDARPLFDTMEIFKKEKYPDIESKIIAFTTDMMPNQLRAATGRITLRPGRASSLLRLVKKEIRQYVAGHKSDDILLHSYLHQELDCLDRMLFIDTGYWARCVFYLCCFFDDKNTDHVLLRGPEKARCFSVAESGGESVNSFENQINHGFDIVGLKMTGNRAVVMTEEEQYYHRWNLHVADYAAVEANAYAHIGLLTAEKEAELMKKWAGRVRGE